MYTVVVFFMNFARIKYFRCNLLRPFSFHFDFPSITLQSSGVTVDMSVLETWERESFVGGTLSFCVVGYIYEGHSHVLT